jgi:hypothetical protein
MRVDFKTMCEEERKLDINILYMPWCQLSESGLLMYRDYVRSLLGPHMRPSFSASVDQG